MQWPFSVLKIDIICISHIKNNAFADLIEMYQRRMKWPVTIIDYESKHKDAKKTQQDEEQKILSKLNSSAVIIALDERGKSLSSLSFSKKLEMYSHNQSNHIQFVIGGADGLTQKIRDKSHLLMSFGEQTWPHALARVMLLEQIYRAQQILAGHPYHRQ